jgi:anthranilate/para-aminobenzoate synthase component I
MTTQLENNAAALTQLAAGQPALVWRRLVADTETPVGAALKLFEDGCGDFLLESVEGGEVRGRYSLLGLAPDLVFRATGHGAEIMGDRPRRLRRPVRRCPGRTAHAGKRLPHRRAGRAASGAGLPRRLFRL